MSESGGTLQLPTAAPNGSSAAGRWAGANLIYRPQSDRHTMKHTLTSPTALLRQHGGDVAVPGAVGERVHRLQSLEPSKGRPMRTTTMFAIDYE